MTGSVQESPERIPCPKCGKPLAIGRACPGFVPFAFCAPPLSTREMERQITARTGRCSHFNGILSGTCKAGVSYDSFGERQPYRKELPCFADGAPADRCAKRFAPSREEARRELEATHAGCGFMASGEDVAALVRGSVSGGTTEQ